MQHEGKRKYGCDVCRVMGFGALAIVLGIIFLTIEAAVSSTAYIVFFAILGLIGVVFVDRHCAQLNVEAATGASALDGSGREADVSAAAVATRAVGGDRASVDAAIAAERDAAERTVVAAAAAKKASVEDSVALEVVEDVIPADEASPTLAAEEETSAARAASEEAERDAEASRAQAAGETDHDGDGTVEGSFEGTRPQALDGARDGNADDLKRIKGIGPKLEQLCNSLGFYHFDQIASWTADEVAWVDANLEGFKGRVTRDEWVAQAQTLAGGGETDFSKRVDDGDVPSSQ